MHTVRSEDIMCARCDLTDEYVGELMRHTNKEHNDAVRAESSDVKRLSSSCTASFRQIHTVF